MTGAIQFKSIQEAFDSINHCGEVYPEAAIEYLLQKKEEALSFLRLVVQHVVASRNIAYDSPGHGFSFALHFLGFFKDTSTHKEIIEFLRWDTLSINALVGNVLTESMPMILHKTCGGSYESLWSLAVDRKVFECSRWAAVKALIYGAYRGEIQSEELICQAIGMLEKSLVEPTKDRDNEIIDPMIDVLMGFGVKEAIPLLKQFLPIVSEPEELKSRIRDLAHEHPQKILTDLAKEYDHYAPPLFSILAKLWFFWMDPKKVIYELARVLNIPWLVEDDD